MTGCFFVLRARAWGQRDNPSHPSLLRGEGVEEARLDPGRQPCHKAYMSRKKTMSEVLKQAIEASGKSVLSIARDTGLAQSSLSRFVTDVRTLRLDKADVLAEYLGLELVAKRRKPRG